MQSHIIFLLIFIPMISTVIYGAADPGMVSLHSILLSIVIFLWLADSWKSGEFRFSSNVLQLPLLGLILIGCFQLLPFGSSDTTPELLNLPAAASLSLDPYSTRFFVIRLVFYFVFFAAALVFIDSAERVKKIVIAMMIFGVVMAFFGILQWLANPGAIYGLRPTPQAIPFGPFINQHHFAAFMVMMSGPTLALLFSDSVKQDKKLLLVIAAVVMIMAIILTGSRGGMLSYVGVFGLVLFVSISRRFANKSNEPARSFHLGIGAWVAAIILIAAGLVIFLGGGESLLRGTGLVENSGDVTSGRTHFWKTALEIFRGNPIIGVGLDAFGVAYTRFDTRNGLFRVEEAHNEYLQILVDAGILGFACLALFIYFFIRKSLLAIGNATDPFHRRVAIGAFAGCFGILIHSFFDFPLRTPSNGFFFLLLVAIATGAGRQKTEDRSQNSER